MSNRQKANKIIDLLINDIQDRQALGNVYDEIDDGIKKEIIDQWRKLILTVLDRE